MLTCRELLLQKVMSDKRIGVYHNTQYNRVYLNIRYDRGTFTTPQVNDSVQTGNNC